LPYDKWEVVSQLAVDDFVGGLDDGVGDFRVETELNVGLGSSLLQDAESLNNWEGHSLSLAANLEVLKRPLSLGAPVFVSGHLDWTESVSLLSKLSRE
jgi:hypothetical protein